jgi:hypothetical protein
MGNSFFCYRVNYFTAPAVIPEIMYRWTANAKTITGRDNIMEMAAKKLGCGVQARILNKYTGRLTFGDLNNKK